MNIKKIARYFFKEPVVNVHVGTKSKIQYFIIFDGTIRTFTNKKEATQDYKNKTAINGKAIMIKGVICE